MNYKFSEKFMGIIEYKILFPIIMFIGILIFFLYIFHIDFFVSFGVIIMLSLPPILILSTGINGQPAIPYLKAILIFNSKRKLYIYK